MMLYSTHTWALVPTCWSSICIWVCRVIREAHLWSRLYTFWTPSKKGEKAMWPQQESTTFHQPCEKKNELLARIKGTSDQCTQDSSQALLGNICTRLWILHHTVSGRKRCWKQKERQPTISETPTKLRRMCLTLNVLFSYSAIKVC